MPSVYLSGRILRQLNSSRLVGKRAALNVNAGGVEETAGFWGLGHLIFEYCLFYLACMSACGYSVFVCACACSKHVSKLLLCLYSWVALLPRFGYNFSLAKVVFFFFPVDFYRLDSLQNVLKDLLQYPPHLTRSPNLWVEWEVAISPKSRDITWVLTWLSERHRGVHISGGKTSNNGVWQWQRR